MVALKVLCLHPSDYFRGVFNVNLVPVSERLAREAAAHFARKAPLVPALFSDPHGVWVGVAVGEAVCGSVFFGRRERELANVLKANTGNILPGFIAPPGAQALLALGGGTSVAAKNRTEGGFALAIAPGASVVVVGHQHSVAIGGGHYEAEYTVPLAFLLGAAAGDDANTLSARQAALFQDAQRFWERS